jgi:hypothetical protein
MIKNNMRPDVIKKYEKFGSILFSEAIKLNIERLCFTEEEIVLLDSL